jgi:eukaryotic-like serine/threonine-protein kinase
MSPEQNPQRIGDYEILGVLGAGGMGKVYKVRNVISDRVEAMKILLPDLAGEKDLAERFLREIKLLASLSHPNIAALRTALTLNNQLVMIMEYVEGMSLSARVTQGPVAPADAADYIEQVLMALAYAHRQHIIHRDVKPANMMLTPQGLVKLMDFGIARSAADRGLTTTGTTLGSLYYLSPEQIRGEAVDARSDLYSAGVSLYELVTGCRPFQSDSNYSLMAAHIQEAPKPPIELQPDLPATLNQIILMAMAKDPAQRFQSAEAFDNALRSVAATLPKSAAGAVAAVGASPAGAAAVPHGSALTAAAAAPPPAPAAPQTVQPPSQAHIQSGTAPEAGSGSPVAQPANAAPEPAPRSSPMPAPIMPPPGAQPSHTSRGLYMTLGALLVVAVIAAAAVYGPRLAKTRASGSTGPAAEPAASAQPSQPAAPPATPAESASSTQAAGPGSTAASGGPSPSPPFAAGVEPANRTPASKEPSSPPAKEQFATSRKSAPSAATPKPQQAAAPAPVQDGSGSGPGSAQQAQPAAATPANAPAAAAEAAALDDVEKQMDQLTSRAGAVKDSIDKLRQEMAAQGSNLRGDINASERRMETYMSRAQTAYQNQDAKGAKHYLDQAEPEVETLEKFLGRR